MKSVLHVEFKEPNSIEITSISIEGVHPFQLYAVAEYIKHVADMQVNEMIQRNRVQVATAEDVKQILK